MSLPLLFLATLQVVPRDERLVGIVLRDDHGAITPISRSDALALMARGAKKTRRRYVAGLLFDVAHDGFDPSSWKHVIRRPRHQGLQTGTARGRRLYYRLQPNDEKPASVVCVIFPSGSAPSSTRPARDACSLLTGVSLRPPEALRHHPPLADALLSARTRRSMRTSAGVSSPTD